MKNRLAAWLAYRLPHRVLYWATIRSYVVASEKFSGVPLPDLTPDQVLRTLSSKYEGA